jgi:hypothetical protein
MPGINNASPSARRGAPTADTDRTRLGRRPHRRGQSGRAGAPTRSLRRHPRGSPLEGDARGPRGWQEAQRDRAFHERTAHVRYDSWRGSARGRPGQSRGLQRGYTAAPLGGAGSDITGELRTKSAPIRVLAPIPRVVAPSRQARLSLERTRPRGRSVAWKPRHEVDGRLAEPAVLLVVVEQLRRVHVEQRAPFVAGI